MIEEFDGWMFGLNWCDVGLLQIDQLICVVFDFVCCNLIVVYFVIGWWKVKSIFNFDIFNVCFVLVVEIDVGIVLVEFYVEVQVVIDNMVVVVVVV